MLKHRFITALILIPIIISMLFLLSPTAFAGVILIICMQAAWEWGQLAGFVNSRQRLCLAMLCGLLLVIMLLSISKHQYSINLLQINIPLWISLGWWLIALILVLTYPRSAVLWRNSRILTIIFGAFIIIPFFCGMFAIRQYNYQQSHTIGAWWLLYLILLVCSTDSGAYFFGKKFGKHKLMVKVSPAKTWEGLLGGLLTSALICWLFSNYSQLEFSHKKLLICSIVAVFASVLGDLSESMFKREAGIKDSGHLIPGHGGIFDRIDSLTAAVPVFTCLMLLVF
ncbi:phosphatidate cytidylyltransferase [Candidatus Fukatsuia anoeciicola]|uniref:phosphatidate cytidylyltransferase n=1 Tax=Candidatus Fukatsuia anoeciicola TaxID=2994492 RepID=UPI003464C040